jgi:hypothetical protein
MNDFDLLGGCSHLGKDHFIENHFVEVIKLIENYLWNIDAHGVGVERGEEGAPHVPPQKTLINCSIKMQ